MIGGLVANAIAATPEGGTVEVSLQRVGPLLELSVIDGGAGLDAEQIEHAFEPHRPHADRARQRGGALGLVVARHLVLLHGGTISVRSEGPGRGACFALRIPLLPASPPPTTGA